MSARTATCTQLPVNDLGGIRQSAGPLETHWSLVLWDPWFAIGGACFFALAIGIRGRLADDTRS